MDKKTLIVLATLIIALILMSIAERHSNRQKTERLELSVQSLESRLYASELVASESSSRILILQDDADALQAALTHCSSELQGCGRWYAQREYAADADF